MSMPQVGQSFGRYHIDSQIGVGGMGVVFLATDTQLKRQVALKVVSAQYSQSEEFLTRFRREAEVMARVDSPHIVAIFDYGTTDDCPWLASQFVGGGDLSHRLRQGGGLPTYQAAAVCAQVASALGAAHNAGVVHRDVKPSNVLLRGRDGVPEGNQGGDMYAYLCDFGIAQPDDNAGLTQTGSVAGSWGYLAPERVNGDAASAASDIYAVGCLLWACLVGTPPYTGSDIQVAMAHTSAEIPQLAGQDPISTRLNQILVRSMAKATGDRYATAEELRTDLLAVARDAQHAATAGTQIRPVAGAPVAGGAAGAGAGFGAGAGAGQGFAHSGTGAGGPAGNQHKKKKMWPWLAGAAALLVLVVGGGIIGVNALGGSDSKSSSASGEKKTGGEGTSGRRAVPGDANGDGKADLTWKVTGQSVTQRITQMSDTDGGYSSAKVFKWAGGFQVFAGDINNDGKADLMSVDTSASDGVTIRVVDKVVGESKIYNLPTTSINTAYATPGDYNGDGWTDLVFFQDNDKAKGVTVYVALGKKGGDGWEMPKTWLKKEQWTSITYFAAAGDFTGDGKDDLAVMFDAQNLAGYTDKKVESGTHLAVSDGKQFTLSKAPPRSFPLPMKLKKEGGVSWRVVGDLTGDKKPVQVFINQYPTKREVSIMTWDDKQGFSAMSKPWYDGPTPPKAAGDGISDDTFDLADINGDGKDDLVILHQIAKGTYQVMWQESTGTTLKKPEVLATYASPLPRAWTGRLAEVF